MRNEASASEAGFPKWLLALGAMMLLMLGANGVMVWLSTLGHRDLVRPDYYEAGLDQDGILARTGLSESQGVDVSLFRDEAEWRAEAGGEALRNATCKVRLYRPDNGRDDLVLELIAPTPASDASARRVWKGPSPILRRGYWVARLVWEDAGRPVMEKSYRIFVSG
jgi:hypothetical protein